MYRPLIGYQVVESSNVRKCDFCGKYATFDNPDADFCICGECANVVEDAL